MAELQTKSVLLGVDDVKVSPLISDTSIGAEYGEAVDVPGIQSVELNPAFMEKDLRGDESIIDVFSRLEQIEWNIEHGVISLDALEVLLGGEVKAGEGTQTYSLTGADVAGYFKLEALVKYSDVGDVEFILHKCKCTGLTYTLTGEEYATFSANGKAIPTVAGGKIKDIVFNGDDSGDV